MKPFVTIQPPQILCLSLLWNVAVGGTTNLNHSSIASVIEAGEKALISKNCLSLKLNYEAVPAPLHSSIEFEK